MDGSCGWMGAVDGWELWMDGTCRCDWGAVDVNWIGCLMLGLTVGKLAIESYKVADSCYLQLLMIVDTLIELPMGS
jgi:fluoride ion exporter CrcB/FEX